MMTQLRPRMLEELQRPSRITPSDALSSGPLVYASMIVCPDCGPQSRAVILRELASQAGLRVEPAYS